MSTQPTVVDLAANTSEGSKPPIAHAWCSCYERDGITPFPSICGQSFKSHVPHDTNWPANKQACVLCDEMCKASTPCLRCGGVE